jgi:hypothetical protein
MIDQIFPLIADRLATQVPELLWVDLDQDQFANEDQEYAIPYPAALIDFDEATWQDIGEGVQNGDQIIRIRIGMQVLEDTYKLSTQRVAAMAKLSLVNKVHKALQNWQAEGFNKLTRISSGRVKGMPVWTYELAYRCLTTDRMAQEQYDLVEPVQLAAKPVWVKQ